MNFSFWTRYLSSLLWMSVLHADEYLCGIFGFTNGQFRGTITRW